ncbi:PREDICTED: GDSL esterase/lipase At1g09390-like [Ipomoea nil]|uniref:GDSL esterase/lipase At1g09390-like n=1 Tax=Ipomoea nil TaxID=35883 RepID=UPI000900EBD4|nr:PREDICTED: GDSL esterase/lipase At1g09390-like [Ipomoea nil]
MDSKVTMFGVFFTVAILGCHPSLASDDKCFIPPVIFNFGDSNSDTGGYAATHGQFFGSPNGRVFSGNFSDRMCDGRLIINFLCESLKTPYLSPFLESLTSSFENGVNFAVSGSKTVKKDNEDELFTLSTQVLQFRRFRTISLKLHAAGTKGAFGDMDFEKAMYMIDIGQNDISQAFLEDHLSKPQVISNISSFIFQIKSAINVLYHAGGRNFWVHNTGPLGCLPYVLTKLGGEVGAQFDEIGCLKSQNEVAQEFNTKLRELCNELRHELNDSMIVYVDIYMIKYSLISNYRLYGFESPLMACCGGGGAPYNAKIFCGQGTVCNIGQRFISWDGVHYTDNANAVFAAQIASTNYSTPPLKFNYFCT